MTFQYLYTYSVFQTRVAKTWSSFKRLPSHTPSQETDGCSQPPRQEKEIMMKAGFDRADTSKLLLQEI